MEVHSSTVAGLRAIALDKHEAATDNARLYRSNGHRERACMALEHAAAARFVYANAERIHAGAL